MSNENNNNPTPAAEPAVETTHQDYIEAIQELRNSTVSKERYDALVKENKSLIQTLAAGGTIPGQTVPTRRTSAEIRQELWGSGKKHSETGYLELGLELREAVLDETGEDIFVAKGHHVQPTAEAYAASQRLAETYREILDYANGDDEVFINELSRRMVDNPIMANKNKIRR